MITLFQTNAPFDYCWFQHPIHTLLSVSDKIVYPEMSDVQYFGDGFNLGQCGVKIRRFHFSDAGEWKCGMGRVSNGMKEALKTIKVEVKGSFMMAATKEIKDLSGNPTTIQCRAIPIGSRLESCHFLSPNLEAFSMNELVMETNAIDGKYYWDVNRKLADGYCVVVIKALEKEMAGKWLCSGKIVGRDEESFDSVYVEVDGIRKASFSYLSILAVIPVAFVLASTALVYRKWKRRQQNQMLDEISMHTINSSSTENSASSGYSA